MGDCWPEQDAVDLWWRKQRHGLKMAVSEYRIEIERREIKLHTALELIADGVSPDSDVGPTLNFCRQTAQKALGRPVDTDPISFDQKGGL